MGPVKQLKMRRTFLKNSKNLKIEIKQIKGKNGNCEATKNEKNFIEKLQKLPNYHKRYN